MHKILEKRQLSADVFYMKVEAVNIARNRKPGQFVIVQIDIDPSSPSLMPPSEKDLEEVLGYFNIKNSMVRQVLKDFFSIVGLDMALTLKISI